MSSFQSFQLQTVPALDDIWQLSVKAFGRLQATAGMARNFQLVTALRDAYQPLSGWPSGLRRQTQGDEPFSQEGFLVSE